jgi:lipopolysaccharide biosynthesis regulator YciM
LLEPLVANEPASADLRSALGRVYLQAGQLDRAEAHFAAVEAEEDVPESTKALNKAFLASARGEWDAAAVILRELFAEDDTNYAVSFLFFGTLSQSLV